MPLTGTDLLSPDLAMGAVSLRVGDLDAMTAFYRDVITLDVLGQTGGRVVLGRGTTPIVVLEHAPELRHAAPRSAGLFHTAILFETQAQLAAALQSVAMRAPALFTGSADHLVSQAFYLSDPEGNGIELYWDRSRDRWSWTHGEVEMASLMLDPNAFLAEHLSADAAPGPASVGHVHLSVGDVATAREFYVDRLGFETTARFGSSALFVSAGGYHHHMAMNTWASAGAGRRGPARGLGRVEILLPTPDDLGATVERMRDSGVATRDDGDSVAFDDPWANELTLRAAPAPRPARAISPAASAAGSASDRGSSD